MRSAFCCAMFAMQLFQASAASEPFAARSWLISVCWAEKLYGSAAADAAGWPSTTASAIVQATVSEREKNLPMYRITRHRASRLRTLTAPLPTAYRPLSSRHRLVSGRAGRGLWRLPQDQLRRDVPVRPVAAAG